MAKKRGNTERRIRISQDAENLNKILVENFVSLQKAVTNLAGRFDDLSIQISKLLQLFEISAKSFSEKLATTMPEIEKDKEFLGKLNTLLDQNKVIAKGLTLMEERIRERLYGQPPPSPAKPAMPRFMPTAIPRQSIVYSPYPATPEEEPRTKDLEE